MVPNERNLIQILKENTHVKHWKYNLHIIILESVLTTLMKEGKNKIKKNAISIKNYNIIYALPDIADLGNPDYMTRKTAENYFTWMF